MVTLTTQDLSMELVPEEAVEIDIVDVPFYADPEDEAESKPDLETKLEPKAEHDTDFEDDENEGVSNFYVIIYLPGRSPEREYEIISNEVVVEDSWTSLQKGSYIDIIESNRITRGEVVLVSDEIEYCRENYEKNVTAHREERSRRVKVKNTERVKQPRKSKKAKKVDVSSSSSSLNSCTSSCFDNESPNTTMTAVSSSTSIVSVKDQETQTEHESEYEVLKKKYQSMCEVADKFKKMFKEVQANMNQSLNKFQLFNQTTNIEDSEASTSTSRVTPPSETSSDEDKENLGPIITLGSNGTTINRKQYSKINWKTKTQCIRDLMTYVFTRNEMATRSLTGRPSPAFINSKKRVKSPLNQEKVEDIIEFVKKKTGMDEQNIRQGITTKCADENKMFKRRLQKTQKRNSKS